MRKQIETVSLNSSNTVSVMKDTNGEEGGMDRGCFRLKETTEPSQQNKTSDP